MTEVEIGLVVGFLSLVVKSIADHFVSRGKAEQWVRDTFASLVSDLTERIERTEAHHAKCQEELRRMNAILVDITVIEPEPAE